MDLEFGVPQGSIVSSPLFVFYLKDIMISEKFSKKIPELRYF